MIVTEAALREQLRQPRYGGRVRVPPGATLSPSAADFVAHWRLEIIEEDAPAGPAGLGQASGPASWDRPSSFPVSLEGTPPRCTTCGSEVAAKPDGLTQLDACHFVAKTHPRIRLRGAVDGLQALALLAAARAREASATEASATGAGATEAGATEVAKGLATVAAYCRELMSAEYNERPAAAPQLLGLDEKSLHEATHDPRSALGIDHVTPGPEHPELLHWLNLLRCQVRAAELDALAAFGSPHHSYGASICHGLNRLSSLVYYLELRLMARRTGVGGG